MRLSLYPELKHRAIECVIDRAKAARSDLYVPDIG